MKLSREELYNLVWSEPILKLCKMFGLSDNGVRKHCKNMNIPTPPQGYWAKIESGQTIPTTPLPTDYKEKQEVEYRVVSANNKKNESTDNDTNEKSESNTLQEIEDEILSADKSLYTVPEMLYAKDPLIIDTKEYYRSFNDEYVEARNRNPYKSKIKDHLHIIASNDSLDRALRIFVTIIKLLQFRGHSLMIENNETYAIVNEEKIKILISERRKQVNSTTKETDFCGELRFIISWGWNFYNKQEFKDTSTIKVEDRIVSIIARLEIVSKEIKERREADELARLRRQEEERRKEERKKLEEIEVKKLKSLIHDMNLYHAANAIRNYIDIVEQNSIAGGYQSEENQQLLEWARKKADWLDPTSEYQDDLLSNNYSPYDFIKIENSNSTSWGINQNTSDNRFPFWLKYNKR